MDILMSETCWAHKKWNKIASDIKLVFHSSTQWLLNFQPWIFLKLNCNEWVETFCCTVKIHAILALLITLWIKKYLFAKQFTQIHTDYHLKWLRLDIRTLSLFQAKNSSPYVAITRHVSKKLRVLLDIIWVSWGLASCIVKLDTRWMSNQFHAPAALPPGK